MITDTTQQLIEKFKHYKYDWQHRMDDKVRTNLHIMTVDREDYEILEVLDVNTEPDVGDLRFDVLLLSVSGFGVCAHIAFTLSLSGEDYVARISFLPGRFYDVDKQDKAYLTVSYSDRGVLQLMLRPREMDEPLIAEDHVLLAEILFNGFIDKLGFAAKPPLDFDALRMYICRHEETHEKVLEAWGDLSTHWYKLATAWQGNLIDGDEL
jgi:hypothetical protein